MKDIQKDKERDYWVPEPREGFLLGKISDFGGDTILVQPRDGRKAISASYDRVFPAEDDLTHDVEDNCSLMFLNEATLLYNLKLRYKKDAIYTYVANILIAVNPYHDMKSLYSKDAILKYKGKSLGVLPPHVFAIADKAYRDMKLLKQSQSIIVSGESGAGKTESTKFILRYIAESVGSGSTGNIEQRIVEANPLLESFGNAKTIRNINSSRFGKYVEVHFGDKAQVVGGYISHYLLEKSRICKQNYGERNYHVFYRMCAGAPGNMKTQLKLAAPENFYYLNQGSPKVQGLDDTADFKRLEDAMNAVGITQEERSNIYRVVAAVLHLGNVKFQESVKDKKGGSEVMDNSVGIATDTAKLLGVETAELQMSLTTRIMTTSKGGGMGTIYKVPLKVEQACAARDALAKAIYSKLFDYIVSRVNQCFPFQSSSTYIGVLDIAGFEFFEVNSFEQLCINYCNEKLQQFFNERILKEEQALYSKEGLGVKNVSFVDNQDCIDLFEMKTSGIMDLLSEESKLPKPSEEHFTTELHQRQGKHFRLALPRKSHLQAHRNLRDDQGFMIRHFAGAVCYQTAGFLEKNNDALHSNLEALIQESKDPFLKSLFPAMNTKVSSKKLAFESVGSKFRSQLKLLMEKLASTGSNFIRCIKPNDNMKSNDFEGGQILSQLQCAGMVSVLELMQEGFPSRTSFNDLYTKYKSYLPPKLAKLNPRTFSQALFQAVGMGKDDFKFGMTKVFFRPGKFAEFDQIMKSDPETMSILIAKVQKWIIKNRWKRAIWCAISVQKLANKIKYRREMIIRIQKTVRMFLAIIKHRPRCNAIKRVRKLQAQIELMRQLVTSLKKDKDKYTKQVVDLEALLDNTVKQIKTTNMSQSQIDSACTDLYNRLSNQLNNLKKTQEVQTEQERLQKIQEQMDNDKRRQEEEEKKKREEDEQRKQRVEYEAKMKKEAEEKEKKRAVEEQANIMILEKLRSEHEAAEKEKKAREAQERRDYELALRLAVDNASAVRGKESAQGVSEEREGSLKRGIKHEQNQKYELRSWKYADLRDTINTSCDIELLEACREEFHRRLKVYHAWRKRNKQSQVEGNNQRAPVDVIHNAEQAPPLPDRRDSVLRQNTQKPQRFFRVPFARPSDQYRDPEYKKQGWWYAHFDGEWIARQLEIHPNGVLLFVAGKDDMDMCELSLSETRLTERPGAEITQDEFEQQWRRHGGTLADVTASPRK